MTAAVDKLIDVPVVYGSFVLVYIKWLYSRYVTLPPLHATCHSTPTQYH